MARPSSIDWLVHWMDSLAQESVVLTPALLSIERATVDDIEEIARSYVDSAQHHRELDPELYQVPTVEDVARDLAEHWDSPDQATFVARIDGAVVGSVDVRIVRPRKRGRMVKPRVVADVGIALLGPYRRQGIGHRLMHVAEEWARSQGAETLTLDCHAANDAAIGFYQSLGYRRTGLFMRKPLEMADAHDERDPDHLVAPQAGSPESEHENRGNKPGARSLGWEVKGTGYPLTTPWLTLRRDAVQTANHSPFTYTYVQAPPAVFIVPVTSAGQIMLIRQYRYTVDDWCLEVPAGGTFDRPGQALVDVARDELREEIGGVCRDLRHVATFYTWISRSDQVAHVFLALDVQLETRQALDATENIDLVPVPVQDALRMARRGEIADGQSALSLLLCEKLLRELGYLEEE